MSTKRKPPEISPAVRARIRDGSAKGAAVIQERFKSVLTRKQFCVAVGIHPTTLKRWEAAKVVQPARQSVGGIATMVFDEAEVQIGQEIVRLLGANLGRMSAVEAARIARRKSGS